jgi:hypothetical protein
MEKVNAHVKIPTSNYLYIVILRIVLDDFPTLGHKFLVYVLKGVEKCVNGTES